MRGAWPRFVFAIGLLSSSGLGCGGDDLPPPPPVADASPHDTAAAGDARDASGSEDTAPPPPPVPPCLGLELRETEDLGSLSIPPPDDPMEDRKVRPTMSERHADHMYLAVGDVLLIARVDHGEGRSMFVSSLSTDPPIRRIRGMTTGPDGIYLVYPNASNESVAMVARFSEPTEIKDRIEVPLEIVRHEFPFEDNGYATMFYDWPTGDLWLLGDRGYFLSFGEETINTIGIIFYSRGTMRMNFGTASASKDGRALVARGQFYQGRPSTSLRGEPFQDAPMLSGLAFASDNSGVYAVTSDGTTTFTPCRTE